MIIAIESPRNLKCSRKIVRSSLSLDKIWISVENADGKSGGAGGGEGSETAVQNRLAL